MALVINGNDIESEGFAEEYVLAPGGVIHGPDEPHDKFSDKTSKCELRGPRDSSSPDKPVSQYASASCATLRACSYRHRDSGHTCAF